MWQNVHRCRNQHKSSKLMTRVRFPMALPLKPRLRVGGPPRRALDSLRDDEIESTKNIGEVPPRANEPSRPSKPGTAWLRKVHHPGADRRTSCCCHKFQEADANGGPM